MRRTVDQGLFGTLAGWTLAVLLATALAATGLFAASPAEREDEAAVGGLILRGQGVAEALPAVRLGTDMAVRVTGQVARVKVTQAFRNTSRQWMEATYLYPLPDDGAVDSLRMVVGQRVFTGRIKPREEARQIYQQALDTGRKAGLVEEARANLFRNRVANVGPGETVLIQIEFQAPVREVAGEYALRLPLVAGPRYIPPRSLLDGTGGIDRARFADAAHVTAPVAHPAIADRLNPVSIAIDLAPGFAPARVTSPYHRVRVSDTGPDSRKIVLADGEVPQNRDFVLTWHAAGTAPRLALFREPHEGLDYLMATVSPPGALPPGPVPPRELVFVIDNSGSMAGESMRAAKDSLLYALGTLRPQDRFNVIRFDDTMTRLFTAAVPASADRVALARRFAEALDAEGGTEMLPALKAALDDRSGSADDAPGLRQVIFLTDGDLSNEAEMIAEIAAHRGRSRVFMVGIGSAPNSFLMRRMAESGRGTFTHVGVAGEAEASMRALLDRLTRPVARNLKVETGGVNLELALADLPDLYAGEPLVLLGRGKDLSRGTLTVSGTVGDAPWRETIDLAAARPSDAVARLWARRRIDETEAKRWSGQLDEALADATIEELGLGFHLVTARTSLIAIDETPSRPDGARLTAEELPLLLPAGWDFDHLFGEQPDNPARRAADNQAEQDEQLDLPQGATGFARSIGQGLALLALALALALAAAVSRRRRGSLA